MAKEHIHITCHGSRPEQVECFKYLGAIFTEMGDNKDEIRTCLGMAKGVTYFSVERQKCKTKSVYCYGLVSGPIMDVSH